MRCLDVRPWRGFQAGERRYLRRRGKVSVPGQVSLASSRRANPPTCEGQGGTGWRAWM